jgi:hypothetical protein
LQVKPGHLERKNCQRICNMSVTDHIQGFIEGVFHNLDDLIFIKIKKKASPGSADALDEPERFFEKVYLLTF